MSAPEHGPTITRRRAVTGAAVTGLGLPLLAACGGDGGDSGDSGAGSGGAAASETPTGRSQSPSAGASGTPSGSAAVLTTTDQVPEGGGQILADEKVVVTQPRAGEFKGFSAICTHRGCVVSSVADGTIDCGCHGSRFSIDDGSVVNGPATSPLDAVAITVRGDEITQA